MLIIILATFVLLFLLDSALKMETKTIEVLYRFRLYALRDKLREEAMQRVIDPADWVFDFLDSSIAKSISIISQFSLYKLLVVYFVHKNDPRFESARKHLEVELNKPEKLPLKQIRDEFASIMADYLLDKHRELKPLLSLAHMSVYLWTRLKGMWDKVAEQVPAYPETSTIEHFSPQGKKGIKLSAAFRTS
ncbi:hypothetical protein MUP77_13315 [Candidatus Bathyarchaeota archaeon]|nr:hypothetical protein [Candidatus Bathyarchaeota archaeon]